MESPEVPTEAQMVANGRISTAFYQNLIATNHYQSQVLASSRKCSEMVRLWAASRSLVLATCRWVLATCRQLSLVTAFGRNKRSRIGTDRNSVTSPIASSQLGASRSQQNPSKSGFPGVEPSGAHHHTDKIGQKSGPNHVIKILADCFFLLCPTAHAAA